VREDCASLGIEDAVAILTQIPLKHLIAAIPNHRFATAAWARNAVTPASLLEQVRGATLRDERLDWEHQTSSYAALHPCLL